MFFNQYTKYFVTFTNEHGKCSSLPLGRNQYHILRVLKKRPDERLSIIALYNYITGNWVNPPPISSFYISVHSLIKKGLIKKIKRKGNTTRKRASEFVYQISKQPKNLFVQLTE